MINWDAVGAIGEIVGAVAVVVTLGYLAKQMRQANLHTKSQVRQRMIEQTQEELYVIVNDPSIHELFVRDQTLDPDEQVRLNAYLVSFMRQREFEWLQHEDGVIDKHTYETYYAVIPLLLGTERTRRWWERFGKQGFDQGFVREVDGRLISSGYDSYMNDIRTWDDPRPEQAE
jgi:hypothetical protein